MHKIEGLKMEQMQRQNKNQTENSFDFVYKIIINGVRPM